MKDYNTILVLCGFAVGFVMAYLIKGRIVAGKVRAAKEEALNIIRDAKRKSETLLKEARLEAKDRLFKMKSEFDTETKETRSELKKQERRLISNEENIDKKLENLEHRDREIIRAEKRLDKKTQTIEADERKYNQLVEQQKQQLETISSLTAEQAKELLIRAMENEARHEGAKMIKRIENETREEADKKAKKIMATAIQRYAGDFVAERTVSVVQLPSDEMKGRIIGREGRNIRALEAATGIDLIIDDTPEAVILSGFNPVRREVARLSLMKLISDGRIHPARIEDVVKKVEQEVDVTIKEAGEQAAFDLGVHGIHSELIKYIGRLKFRSSYAQNVLQHSVEVGSLCGIMAAELGLKEKLATGPNLLKNSANRTRSCTRSQPTTRTSLRQRCMLCSCRQPIAFQVQGPVLEKSCWKITSNAWKTWKPSPTASRALPTPMQFRLAESCALSCRARSSQMRIRFC